MTWLLLIAGCDLIQPMPEDQPCQEVGYAIASRTYECTGEPDEANARYNAFQEQFTCVSTDPEEPHFPDLFECSLAISALTCDEVKALGDDLLEWLFVSPTCTHVVRDAEGNPYWGDTGAAP